MFQCITQELWNYIRIKKISGNLKVECPSHEGQDVGSTPTQRICFFNLKVECRFCKPQSEGSSPSRSKAAMAERLLR
jgi:hypothetical protein